MNTRIFVLGIVLLVLLGLNVSSTELTFIEDYCIVGQDCTLNDLFLTGNFSFIGAIVNVTILNQNITGQLSIGGSLNVDGNITALIFIGELKDGFRNENYTAFEDNAFRLENYSNEYSNTGFDNENFTTRYDLRADRFGNENFSTQLVNKNTSQWNLSGDTIFTKDATLDINLSGNQLLEVENITSPFANKSYIFFERDGSVGIMLDPT